MQGTRAEFGEEFEELQLHGGVVARFFEVTSLARQILGWGERSQDSQVCLCGGD